jgi:ribonuclease HI
MKTCSLWFDGAITVNPGGVAAYGFFLVDTIKRKHYPVKSGYGIIGQGDGMTVNVAEYSGLLAGIKEAKRLGYDYLDIHGDSLMVVNMVSRKWGKLDPHGKHPHLLALLSEIWQELEPVMYAITWVPREKNTKADTLSKVPYTKKYKRREARKKVQPISQEQAEKNRENYFNRH